MVEKYKCSYCSWVGGKEELDTDGGHCPCCGDRVNEGVEGKHEDCPGETAGIQYIQSKPTYFPKTYKAILVMLFIKGMVDAYFAIAGGL